MTTQLFHSILTLSNFLKLNLIDNSYKFNFFNNNYILKNNYYNTILNNNIEFHNLKCWNSRCFLDYHLENFNENNMIISLDFSINKEDINNPFIKINYLYVNNDYYDIKYKEYFNFEKRTKLLLESETKLIINSIISFIENIAKYKQIPKIIIDIHSNLERYEYELKELGFIINDKNNENPFWIKAEKII
jgi:hypothetical protein